MQNILVVGKTRVEKAARYVALNAGHLWRPLVVLKTAQAYNISIDKALPYAVGIELVHNATLILDDLPSMDNSNMRRGQAACHIKFGVNIANLCSHYFIANSILLATRGPASEKQKSDILSEVASAAENLIVGQEKDLYDTNDRQTLEDLLEFYRLKSGSLYGSAAVIGGILGNAPSDEINNLRGFGISLGIAYQIGDDLYDKLGNNQDLGKPTGQDIRKKTPIDLIGIDAAFLLRKVLEEKAKSNLRKIQRDFSQLEALISHISGTFIPKNGSEHRATTG